MSPVDLRRWKQATPTATIRDMATYLRTHPVMDTAEMNALAEELERRAEYYDDHYLLVDRHAPTATATDLHNSTIRHAFQGEEPVRCQATANSPTPPSSNSSPRTTKRPLS